MEQDIILVTGSSGLIGSAVAGRLSRDFRVIGFDVEEAKGASSLTEYIYTDMTADASVKHSLNDVRQRYGEQIASVVHLAAYYDFSGEPSPKYEQITVRGTERLLRGLHSFQVEQFLFSSTMLVYAPCQPGQSINEDWPLEPKWDYPKSKVQTERLIREQRGNIPAVLMRIAGVYNDHCHSIPIAHQMQRIYERWLLSHVFPGDLSHGQAFVHVEDVAEAIALAVAYRKQLPPEWPVLVGESETLSYDELQRAFGRLLHNEEGKTYEIPKALAKAGAWIEEELPLGEEPFIKPWMIDIADDHYALDITRARNLLGWEPKHTLRETLPQMVASLIADPRGFYQENKLKPPERVQEQPKQQARGY